jgi:hypothetical protein
LKESAEYSKCGRPCSKHEAYRSLANDLTDDTAKPFLTVVADKSEQDKVKQAFDSHKGLAGLKDKLHIQYYDPSHWMVKEIGLAKGISWQGPQRADGKAPVEWRLPVFADATGLFDAIRKADPTYDPSKDHDPSKPSVDPVKPTPANPDGGGNWVPDLSKINPNLCCLIAAAIIALYFYRKRNEAK